MFDLFTDRARRAVSAARKECMRLQHSWLGTEHVLLGLLADPENIAAAVFRERGDDLGRMRSETEALAGGRGTEPVMESLIAFTRQAKTALERAVDEASLSKSNCIDTGHVLFGLIKDKGIGGAVLAAHGMDREALRAARAALGARLPIESR